MLDRDSVAILIFSHSPEESARRKSWLPSFKKNVELHKRVNQHLHALAEDTAVDVFSIDESMQTGPEFQDRLWNAIAYVFQRGFQSVLVMGGDTPSLTQSILTESIAQLRKGKNVLGPSRDGGTYLLGLQAGTFEYLRQQKIIWQKGRDYGQLCDLLFSFPVWKAPLLVDWDKASDMRLQLRQFPLLPLWRKLLSDLLILFQRFCLLVPFQPGTLLFPLSVGLRAPPK